MKSTKDILEKEKNLKDSSFHPPNAGDFKYYKIISINHSKVSGTGNLIDFPILISIFDSDLHNDTQPDGDDIAFANNFQWLAHEIELFNQNYNSTHAQLVAWVRVPVLSASEDTIIRMYYGNSIMETRENPNGVWDPNFKLVHHLEETTGSISYDSTSNSRNGVIQGSPTLGVTGNIGNCFQFDDTPENQRVRLSSLGSLMAFTMEIWAYPNSGERESIWGRDFQIDTMVEGTGITYSTYNPKFFGAVIPDGPPGPGSSRVDINAESETSDNLWNHLVITYNGSTLRMYANGDEVADSPKTGMSSPNYLFANNHYFAYGGYNWATEEMWFSGKLDEARFSDVARSTEWIETEYNNQGDSNSFYFISDENYVYIPSIFDFQYFKEIRIDHTKVSGTNSLINFPILVSFFDSDLHDKVQPNGDDIAFNNGTTWLFHEIELFIQNYNSTHAQLIAWICIPKLSPFEDTIIRMYYGNSTMDSQENNFGVWDSNFIGVWHLNEPSGPVMDSTLNRYNGVVTGASSTSSAIIDGGYEFVRSETDYIEMLGTGDKLQLEDFTVEVWMKTPDSTVPDDYYLVTQSLYYDTESWAINICDDTGHLNEGRFTLKISGEQQIVYSNSEITGNEWHHLVGVRGSSQLFIYIDGVLANSITDDKPGQFIKSSKNISFGSAITVDSEDFNGLLDEVRISAVARSADWIKTEYNNQFTPNSFYSLGDETKIEDDKPQNDFYFRFYKIIKIDNSLVFGSGFHSNFPVLISLFDSDLHSDVQLDGDDIAFSLGTTWLDHEIELFNQNYNVTHAQLIAWVRIPELSTSLDTYIRMYYGNSTMSSCENPAGVWDGSYKGVWHLAESSGVTIDSTSYIENGIVTGTVIRPSSGQIGNAYSYGTDGTFNVGDPADGHLDFTTESFTVSMWINIDTSTGTYQIPLYKGATSTWNPGYCFGTPPTGDSLSFHITDGNDNIGSPDASITFDTWAYIVGFVDRTNDLIHIYKDGYEVGSGTDISSILSLTDTENIEFQCANPTYDFDGLLDEVRVINATRSNNWIKTEYYNQYNPNSFYSIGLEQGVAGIKYSNLQVKAVDLYGNSVSFANVSVYNQTILLRSNTTDSNGNTLFTDLTQAEYNFTVSITSDIGNYVEIVNTTFEAIMINQSFQTVNLICNVGSNFFDVTDIDGVYLDSGWIIVGNSSQELQNCSIDSNGHAKFWWVNTTPYEYNYTIYYQDSNYNPKTIQVASGDINTPNASIQVQAVLTTIDFTIQTLITKQPVSGVKCILTANISGESIVNLTT
ncbi:MAG: DUF2341 domain-containing protein, partial [Promethearchaeota archaeon]